ncbi:MAG TPA: hypothetical protein VGV88_14780 [Candidatus Dormibacteraeota bacterium]|nr:hypothetical protein [Candidatus Dormibacteraeota bacterium]
MKLIRRWLATSTPIPEMTAATVSPHLERAAKPDQFAVFDLPAKNLFVQAKRMASGGLHIEVSRKTPEVEALLHTLGEVTMIEDYGFPSVNASPGDDGRVAQVIAQVLAMLAAQAGVTNLARVRNG